MRGIAVSTVLAMMLWGCSGGGGEAPRATSPSAAGGSAFAALESDLFAPKCVHAGCHGGDSPAGGLDLRKHAAYDALVGVPAHRRPEHLLVKAGDPHASYLLQRLVPGGDTPLMPLGGQALSKADVDRIRAWIQDGAKK